MKRGSVLFVLLLGIACAPAPAGAATQLGIRGGYAHASRDIFQGSGGVGGTGLYGVVASMGLFPLIDLEFAYERYQKNLSFDRAGLNEVLSGKAKYDDQAYLLTGKMHVPLLGPGPIGLYGGAGVSVHSIRLKDPEQAVQDYFRQNGVSTDRSEFEWHAVVGADLGVPVLPLRAYAEYRFQNITGRNNPRYSSIYAGLNLYLK